MCSPNYFKSFEGIAKPTPVCTPCPPNTVSYGGSTCTCDAGYYNAAGDTPDQELECLRTSFVRARRRQNSQWQALTHRSIRGQLDGPHTSSMPERQCRRARQQQLHSYADVAVLLECLRKLCV